MHIRMNAIVQLDLIILQCDFFMTIACVNLVYFIKKLINLIYILTDYLEATLYSKEDCVVMLGNFANPTTPKEKAKINHITRWYKLPFYKHVENMLEKGETEEYIPLREYLLRHDKVRVLYFRIMENRVILRQFIVKKN